MTIFLLSIKLVGYCLSSIISVFSWPCEWIFMEEFCKDLSIKILLPVTLGCPQMFKGCDSSLKAEALLGLVHLCSWLNGH